jgi:hypothetical protein
MRVLAYSALTSSWLVDSNITGRRFPQTRIGPLAAKRARGRTLGGGALRPARAVLKTYGKLLSAAKLRTAR